MSRTERTVLSAFIVAVGSFMGLLELFITGMWVAEGAVGWALCTFFCALANLWLVSRLFLPGRIFEGVPVKVLTALDLRRMYVALLRAITGRQAPDYRRIEELERKR